MTGLLHITKPAGGDRLETKMLRSSKTLQPQKDTRRLVPVSMKLEERQAHCGRKQSSAEYFQAQKP